MHAGEAAGEASVFWVWHGVKQNVAAVLTCMTTYSVAAAARNMVPVTFTRCSSMLGSKRKQDMLRVNNSHISMFTFQK